MSTRLSVACGSVPPLTLTCERQGGKFQQARILRKGSAYRAANVEFIVSVLGWLILLLHWISAGKLKEQLFAAVCKRSDRFRSDDAGTSFRELWLHIATSWRLGRNSQFNLLACGVGLVKGLHHPHVVSRSSCRCKTERRHVGGVWGPLYHLSKLGACRSRGTGCECK